jgi:hypothetical protein
MKKEQENVSINDQLFSATVSAHIIKENIAQISHAPLKDITAQQKKMEARKPIYLVRYE